MILQNSYWEKPSILKLSHQIQQLFLCILEVLALQQFGYSTQEMISKIEKDFETKHPLPDILNVKTNSAWIDFFYAYKRKLEAIMKKTETNNAKISRLRRKIQRIQGPSDLTQHQESLLKDCGIEVTWILQSMKTCKKFMSGIKRLATITENSIQRVARDHHLTHPYSVILKIRQQHGYSCRSTIGVVCKLVNFNMFVVPPEIQLMNEQLAECLAEKEKLKRQLSEATSDSLRLISLKLRHNTDYEASRNYIRSRVPPGFDIQMVERNIDTSNVFAVVL